VKRDVLPICRFMRRLSLGGNLVGNFRNEITAKADPKENLPPSDKSLPAYAGEA